MVNERERVVGKMVNKKKVYYHDKNHSRKVRQMNLCLYKSPELCHEVRVSFMKSPLGTTPHPFKPQDRCQTGHQVS